MHQAAGHVARVCTTIEHARTSQYSAVRSGAAHRLVQRADGVVELLAAPVGRRMRSPSTFSSQASVISSFFLRPPWPGLSSVLSSFAGRRYRHSHQAMDCHAFHSWYRFDGIAPGDNLFQIVGGTIGCSTY